MLLQKLSHAAVCHHAQRHWLATMPPKQVSDAGVMIALPAVHVKLSNAVQGACIEEALHVLAIKTVPVCCCFCRLL
jgi:hypothetical protein